MSDEKQIRLIDVLDKHTQELIFRAKQKLEGIRAEVGTKLESASFDPELPQPELIEKLKTLQQETEKSLVTIDTAIVMTLGHSIDIEQYRQENEAYMTEFAAQLEKFVDQAGEILSKF